MSISIVTIDGTEADLDSLEPLCDKTGGDVEIVKPTELADNFAAILSEPVVASKVAVTMKLHKDSEVMFEYRVADRGLEVDTLPFQVRGRTAAAAAVTAIHCHSSFNLLCCGTSGTH